MTPEEEETNLETAASPSASAVKSISPVREALYWRADRVKNALYQTYKRNYFAAKWVGLLGWGLNLLTAIIGAVLIYTLTREAAPTFPGLRELATLTPTDLAIVILVASLVSAFYGPRLRSRVYYNAGQEHQELYDQFVDFIEMDIPNLDANIDDLRARYEQLNHHRHKLNQSTPQLGGLWYNIMTAYRKLVVIYATVAPWKEQDEWSQIPLEDRVFTKP